MLTGIRADRLLWWQDRCVILRVYALLKLLLAEPQSSEFPRPQSFYVCVNLLNLYNKASLVAFR